MTFAMWLIRKLIPHDLISPTVFNIDSWTSAWNTMQLLARSDAPVKFICLACSVYIGCYMAILKDFKYLGVWIELEENKQTYQMGSGPPRGDYSRSGRNTTNSFGGEMNSQTTLQHAHIFTKICQEMSIFLQIWNQQEVQTRHN